MSRSRRQPLRVIIPKLPMPPNSPGFPEQHIPRVTTQTPSIASTATRSTQRPPQSIQQQRTRPRRMNTINENRSAPGTSAEMAEVPNAPRIIVSSPSPGRAASVEPALLPGGGVQVPKGFHISQTDMGHYRPQSRDRMAGEPDPARMLGKMFRGLKKIPGVLIRAGRTRTGEEAYLEPDADVGDVNLAPGPNQSRLPPRSDVETYVSGAILDDDVTVLQDERLNEYTRRRLQNRDVAFSNGAASVRSPYLAPPPQPIPVPGSHTPSASQAGFSDVPPASLNARLEAEQMRQENEALLEAQERERARIYAADLVRSPPSTVRYASRVDDPESGTGNGNRSRSEPVSHLPHRVFSRWAAARDPDGNRIENPPDRAEIRSAPTPASAIVRIFRQIRDMPWVGERIAADYVPGGVKPPLQAPFFNYNRYENSYGSQYPAPGSDSAFSSPYVPSELRYPDPSIPRIKPGQSWFVTDDYDIVTLPVGVPPPPGFAPIPYPLPENARPTGPPPDIDPAYSSSSHTPVESRTPSPHSNSHVLANGPYARYMPAEASLTGRSFTFVPGGRHQPMVIPSESGSSSPIIPPPSRVSRMR